MVYFDLEMKCRIAMSLVLRRQEDFLIASCMDRKVFNAAS